MPEVEVLDTASGLRWRLRDEEQLHRSLGELLSRLEAEQHRLRRPPRRR